VDAGLGIDAFAMFSYQHYCAWYLYEQWSIEMERRATEDGGGDGGGFGEDEHWNAEPPVDPATVPHVYHWRGGASCNPC
jgi:hypothetical protein